MVFELQANNPFDAPNGGQLRGMLCAILLVVDVIVQLAMTAFGAPAGPMFLRSAEWCFAIAAPCQHVLLRLASRPTADLNIVILAVSSDPFVRCAACPPP